MRKRRGEREEAPHPFPTKLIGSWSQYMTWFALYKERSCFSIFSFCENTMQLEEKKKKKKKKLSGISLHYDMRIVIREAMLE